MLSKLFQFAVFARSKLLPPSPLQRCFHRRMLGTRAPIGMALLKVPVPADMTQVTWYTEQGTPS